VGLVPHCSIWVGLDGYGGLKDLVQAGTEGYVTTFAVTEVSSGHLLGYLILSAYFAWTEFLPQQPTEQVLNSFVVRPGDEIYTEIYLPLNTSGTIASFLLVNKTTGAAVWAGTPVGTTVVKGNQAVWITERPTGFHQPSGIFGAFQALDDLARYASFVMYDAHARKSNSPFGQGYVPYFSDSTIRVTMTNAQNDILSTVTSQDSTSMRFDWQRFN
jgi:Peptidase A4 family